MTADGLVQWCKDKLGQGYIFAAYFDRIITEAYIQAKAKQYPDQYTPRYIERSRKWIGHYAGDCVGLIKSYYWFDGEKVRYGYQGHVDTSANGMYKLAAVKGNISTIPEIPGVFVHYSGHIGVYIGNGEVIEARGVDYGVVKTKIKDRPWQHWGQVPYLDYGSDDMRKGSKGSGVKLWQNRLIQWNKDALPRFGADGDFGGETEDWTKRFQSAVNLPQDGIVGAAEWDAMIETLEGDSAKVEKLEKQLADAQNEKLIVENQLAQADRTLEQIRDAIQVLREI